MHFPLGKILTTTALSVGLATLAHADGTVHIYNWSDYIGEETLAAFQKDTGIKPVYDLSLIHI